MSDFVQVLKGAFMVSEVVAYHYIGSGTPKLNIVFRGGGTLSLDGEDAELAKEAIDKTLNPRLIRELKA